MADRPAPGAGAAEPACCPSFAAHRTTDCVSHRGPDRPWVCPDVALAQLADGSYGLPVRDGGRSVVSIAFCPWCGTPLPTGD